MVNGERVSNGDTLNSDEFIGREITFKVEGRCVDSEAGTQTKPIEAILDKGEAPAPESPPLIRVVCEGLEETPDTLFDGGGYESDGDLTFSLLDVLVFKAHLVQVDVDDSHRLVRAPGATREVGDVVRT